MITGATAGIGRAIALRLAGLGYRLILVGRRAHRLEAVKREIEAQNQAQNQTQNQAQNQAQIEAQNSGTQVFALVLDVSDRGGVEQAVAQLPEQWRGIDVLVNNAGGALGLEHIDEGDPDDWDRMIDTNVKGLLYMTRAVVPLIKQRGAGGHIINIGSIAGRQTYENGAVYCATKYAVNALTQGMRIDLLRDGIRVSQVRPGMVDTEFSTVRFHGDAQRAAGVYAGLTPLVADDVAGVVEWILSLPGHVNVNDIEVVPTRQADAFYTDRTEINR